MESSPPRKRSISANTRLGLSTSQPSREEKITPTDKQLPLVYRSMPSITEGCKSVTINSHDTDHVFFCIVRNKENKKKEKKLLMLKIG